MKFVNQQCICVTLQVFILKFIFNFRRSQKPDVCHEEEIKEPETQLLSTSVHFYSDSLPCHQFLLLQLLLWNLRRKLSVSDDTRTNIGDQSAHMLLRFNSLFSWFIQRCPKWSSAQHLWVGVFTQTQRTKTVCPNTSVVYVLPPFSSGRSPPLVWGRSAPSRSGSSRCGTESSCRGWCGRERGTCVSSS